MNVTDAPEYPCPGNYSGQGNTTLEGCEAKLKEDLHSKVRLWRFFLVKNG
jgi:hypothetical protein